jgi:two-component system CheB/CheR fusion protein
MQVVGVTRLEEYIARLKKDPDEVNLLFRDLLIGVTNFFRDPEAFEALTHLVIPRLFEGKAPADSVRVWCPACATGGEVYSLAILLREHMDGIGPLPRCKSCATKYRRADHRDCAHRILSAPNAGRRVAGAAQAVLASRRRELHGAQRAAGFVHLLGTQRHCAIRRSPRRLDLLPQPLESISTVRSSRG